MPQEPSISPAKNAADAVRAALVDLFLMPTPEETLRRACAAFRDLFGARSCWMHGMPLAYEPEPDIPAPADATYVTAESASPADPPPSRDTIRALYGAAGGLGIDDASRIVRRLLVNGKPWGLLFIDGPSPAAAADETVHDLFRQLLDAVQGLLCHIVRGERLRSARAFFGQIADELPGAIFLVNRSHRIVFLNDKTEKLARMARDQIMRDGCFGLFCDHKTNFAKCPGHASLYSGEPWDGEVDLDSRHYVVHIRPLRVGDRIPYSVIVLDDQTESHRQRELLKKTIDRISVLLDQSTRIRRCLASFATAEDADAIYSTALREAITLFHSPYTFLCRFEPDGSLVRIRGEFGENVPETSFLTPEVRGAIARRFSYAGELFYERGQKENHDADIESMLEASNTRSVYFAAIRLNGKAWGYLGSLSNATKPLTLSDIEIRRDIVNLVEIAVSRASLVAEVAKREKALVKAAEEASASARAKTMFLATMSHEIRTPLNAIIGFAEALGRDEALDEEARGYSAGITRSATALLDLLNDILDLSKLEAGGTQMRTGQCDLPAISREIASIFRYSANARGIELRDSVPEPFPLLRLDGPRIRQVLLNLVGNAVKFTRRGSVEWSAAYAPAANGTVSLSIDVRDTGEGIPKDRQEAIFDPFVQVEGFRPDARAGQKGTGLGLPIVKRLVEACGGTISVQSEVGKGSTFSIRIGSVETIDAPARKTQEAAPPERTLAGLGEEFLPLIVDDIALNLEILALHFRSLGRKNVVKASSGAEALEKMRERRPSIVLTDLWMPGMDGAKLAREIRNDPAFKGIPVVAVTADNDASASFDASIFDAILVKPISTKRLADCISSLIPNE